MSLENNDEQCRAAQEIKRLTFSRGKVGNTGSKEEHKVDVDESLPAMRILSGLIASDLEDGDPEQFVRFTIAPPAPRPNDVYSTV